MNAPVGAAGACEARPLISGTLAFRICVRLQPLNCWSPQLFDYRLEDHVVSIHPSGTAPHVRINFSATPRPEAQELATGSMFGLLLAVAAIVASFNARKVRSDSYPTVC